MDIPTQVIMDVKDKSLGPLAAAAAAGKSYQLGAPLAPFHTMVPRSEGRSPDWTGTVSTEYSSQMEDLLKKLNDQLVVTEELVLGDTITGIQVEGWTLTHFGYDI